MFDSVRLSLEEQNQLDSLLKQRDALQEAYREGQRKITSNRDRSIPFEEQRVLERPLFQALEEEFVKGRDQVEAQIKPLMIRRDMISVLDFLFKKITHVDPENAEMVFEVVVKPLMGELQPVLLRLVQQIADNYERFAGDPAVCGSVARATKNQYEAFVDTGFTADQALTLTSAWVSKAFHVPRPG